MAVPTTRRMALVEKRILRMVCLEIEVLETCCAKELEKRARELSCLGEMMVLMLVLMLMLIEFEN